MEKVSTVMFDAVPRLPREAEVIKEVIEVTESEDVRPASPLENNGTLLPERRKPKKKGSKLSYFNIGRSNKKEPSAEKKSPPAMSPIATQATGNVINIINSNGVHCGPVISYNSMPSKENTSENLEETVLKTTSIKAILVSNDKVSHSYLDIISRNIGSGWRNVFRSMGMTAGMIDIYHEEHIQKGLSEVIYQLALDWVQNEDANLGQLSSAMWAEGKRSLVKQMAAHYKTDNGKQNAEVKEKKMI